MQATLAVVLLLGFSATTAVALDVNDLAPCRAAAARFCDRTGGMTWSNLLQCGGSWLQIAFTSATPVELC